MGLAAVDDVVETADVVEVAEPVGPVEPVAEKALVLPEDEEEEDEVVFVPFSAYIDRRAEPPQYSFALAAQRTVQPLV